MNLNYPDINMDRLVESWESPATRRDQIKVLVTVVVLVILTKVMEHSDYVQLDKRGRSGTRKDLRNWLVQRYVQVRCTGALAFWGLASSPQTKILAITLRR